MSNHRALRHVLAGSGSVLIIALSAAGPVSAQSAPSAQDGAVDEVVVTGLRQSLAAAVDVKRRASQVVDVITAEDVGKLPDDNVAEALQRVTGVQISRVFGEGQSVNIRGLQQVRVEVDGRTLLGWSARLSPPENEQLGRSSGLDTVPSGIFGRLEVRKSPIASQIEGGLGGSVNLITPDPLDFKEPTFRYRLQGTYSEASEELDPAATMLAAGRFLDDRLGLLLALDYSGRTASIQAFERNDFFTTANRDLNADGVSDVSGDRIHYEQFVTDRTRYGANFEAQLRVTDSLDLFLETIYSFQKNERNQDFLTWRYRNNPVTNPTFAGNIIIAGNGEGALTQAGLFREEPTDSYLIATGAEWERGPLSLKGEVSFSASTQEQQIRQITLVSLNSRVPGTFDYRAGVVPSLDLGAFDLTDYDNYRVSEVRANTLLGDLEERAAKIDGAYELEAGPLRRLSAGVRFRELTSSQEALRSTAQVTRTEIEPYLAVLSTPFLPDVPGSFPRSFLTTIADQGYIYQRATGGGPIGRNQARDYNLLESSWAGYLMADFEGLLFGRDYSANAGVRYVTTDLKVSSFLQTNAGLQPVLDRNEYANWLPSANLKVELAEDLLLRFAAARVLQQAGIRELAPSIFVNETNRTASGGNAGLKPTLADQFDVSLEWYYRDGSLLSAAVFAKDVTDFVAETNTPELFPGFEFLGPIPYTRPENIGTAEIRGVELGVQHFFDDLPAPFDGLGVIANYTYSDATDQDGNPLVAVSENSFNLIGLYEKGPFAGRLAFNYRDEAAFSFTQGRPNFIDAIAQLDAQVSYEISDAVTVQFQAVNLIPDDSATVEYSQIGPVALNSYALSDTRYMIGVRGRF